MRCWPLPPFRLLWLVLGLFQMVLSASGGTESQGVGRIPCRAFGQAQGLTAKGILSLEGDAKPSRQNNLNCTGCFGAPPEDYEIDQVLEDRAERLWCATVQGLFRRDAQGWPRFAEESGLLDASVTCLVECSDKALWLAFRNAHELCRIQVQDGWLSIVERIGWEVWGETLRFPFQILPSWWATWWVRVLEGIAFIALLALLIRLVNLALIRRNRMLALEVEKRTQALQQALQEARTANQAKDEFLATVSHEIRTPLHAIQGMTRFLLESRLSGDQRDWAQNIRQATSELLVIINDILDFARMEQTEITLRPVAFDLRELVVDLSDLMGATARSKKLEFRLSWNSDQETMFVGDPDRIRQVLMNLVGNAIKFTLWGNILLEVRTEPLQNDMRRVILSVQDTGIGISEDQLTRIFQKFTQADSSIRRRFGGTGLGLAITHRLVERMGGTITAKSRVGEGSTFTVTLELAAVPALSGDAQSADLSSRRKEKAEIPLTLDFPVKALLVEDNPLNQYVAMRHLQALGVKAVLATSGKEAFRKLENEDFDIIFMDIHMPGQDGLQVTTAIRQWMHDKRIPIVATTAHSLKGDQERFLAAGMDAFLPKPFGREELRDILYTLLSDKRGGSTSPARTSYPIDQEALVDSVIRNGQVDMDALQEIAQLFREYAPIYLEQMETAKAAADVRQMIESTHALLGCGRCLAASRLVELCTSIEQGLEAGESRDLEMDVKTVREEMERVMKDLDRCFRDLEADGG